MTLISIRLPDDIDADLADEAERSQRAKSEIVRDAIVDYLKRQERARFLAKIARAARARGEPEAMAMAEEALPGDNEALAIAEGMVHQAAPAYRKQSRASAKKKRKRKAR
jgi:predicted transcriptional regulator